MFWNGNTQWRVCREAREVGRAGQAVSSALQKMSSRQIRHAMCASGQQYSSRTADPYRSKAISTFRGFDVRVIRDADARRARDASNRAATLTHVAKNIVLVDDDVADMKCRPKLDPEGCATSALCTAHPRAGPPPHILRRHSAGERTSIPSPVVLTIRPTMRGDGGIDKGPSDGLDRLASSSSAPINGCIRQHPPQNSRQSPFHALVGQNKPLDR